MREFEIIRRTYYPFPVKMLMTPNKLPTEVRLYSDVEAPKVRLCERAQLFLKIDGEDLTATAIFQGQETKD